MSDSAILSRPDPFFHWSIQQRSKGKWITIEEFDGLHEIAIDRMKTLPERKYGVQTRVIQRDNPPE